MSTVLLQQESSACAYLVSFIEEKKKNILLHVSFSSNHPQSGQASAVSPAVFCPRFHNQHCMPKFEVLLLTPALLLIADFDRLGIIISLSTEMCSQMFHYQTPLLLVCIILPIITWNHRAKKRTMLAACLCIFKKTKGSSIFGWQVYIVQKLDKKCGTWAKMFNYEFTAGEELPAPF